MNQILIIKGLSLAYEPTPAELSFPDDKTKFAGVSLEFVQAGADIVFPEQLLLFGMSVEQIEPTQTIARRRRFV